MLNKAVGCPVIIIDPVQRMQERGAAVFASPAFTGQVDTSDLDLIRQIHDVLLNRAVGIEIHGTTGGATYWTTFTSGVDAEQVSNIFCTLHGYTREIDWQHG